MKLNDNARQEKQLNVLMLWSSTSPQPLKLLIAKKNDACCYQIWQKHSYASFHIEQHKTTCQSRKCLGFHPQGLANYYVSWILILQRIVNILKIWQKYCCGKQTTLNIITQIDLEEKCFVGTMWMVSVFYFLNLVFMCCMYKEILSEIC